MTMAELSFAFDEQQQAVRELAARILSDKVTPESLRAIEDGDRWLHDDAWQAFRDAQLVTIALPEAYGGGGLGLIELCIMAEEIGRHVAPIPLIEHALACDAIVSSGSEALRSRLAPLLSV
ncbi:MAG: acyl-CoA dehydrogenase family protein, partial [Candidatus Dadabacteria bacterium]